MVTPASLRDKLANEPARSNSCLVAPLYMFSHHPGEFMEETHKRTRPTGGFAGLGRSAPCIILYTVRQPGEGLLGLKALWMMMRTPRAGLIQIPKDAEVFGPLGDPEFSTIPSTPRTPGCLERL